MPTRSRFSKLVAPVLFLTFAATLVAPTSANAKLAGVGDVPSLLESDSTEIEIDADGRSVMTRDSVIRIVNDQGREAQSLQTLSFNSRAQKFQILVAETLNGPPNKLVRTPVPKRDIEIKEVGEMTQAFDSVKQAALSFPKVQAGSRIHLRYRIQNIEIAQKGFWSSAFQIGGDTIESFELKIRSKLPLYFKVDDPKDRFASEKKVSGGVSTLIIHSKTPLYTGVTQEENPFTQPERTPSISISSLPDWNNYAKSMPAVHEAILKKPLLPILEEIKKHALEKEQTIDRIQSVAASVAQNFRYFGDWRRRDGGFIPRSLETISETRYGDCKDLATIVTAVYRSLGYKADVAWIFRGEMAPPAKMYVLPVDTAFNHAISRIEADGKVYWVDATNPVAYARGVYADIADRPAYILSVDGAKLDRTPALKPEDSTFESHLAYEFQKNDSLKVKGDLKLGGRAAIGLTTRAFYSPVEAVNYDVIRTIANGGQVSDSVVGDFERGSRIVNDVTIPVQFTLAESGLRTSAGLGYPLFRDDSIGKVLVDTKDRVSDIYIETPNKTRTTIDLLNVKRIGRTSLDCKLSSDFMDLSRKVLDIKNGVSIVDEITVKKSSLPISIANDASFQKFQIEARSCFTRAAVIVDKN